MVKPRCLDADQTVGQIIRRRIGAGHVDGNLVDVAGQNGVRPDARRRHRQHRRTAADICHVLPDHAAVRQPVQRAQAAQCGAVVPGAKGHCRLDQQRFAVFGHLVRVMAAVDKEPPRLDRRQLAAHMGDPIGFRQL